MRGVLPSGEPIHGPPAKKQAPKMDAAAVRRLRDLLLTVAVRSGYSVSDVARAMRSIKVSERTIRRRVAEVQHASRLVMGDDGPDSS